MAYTTSKLQIDVAFKSKLSKKGKLNATLSVWR